jgi:hypothetical protein
MQNLNILSIDAWRYDGSWSWNAWHKAGTVDRVLIDAKPRKLFRALRDAGYLSAASAGRVSVDDDGYNVVICDRATREPLFAIEYGSFI